jgi:hypothetical protein
VRFWLTEIGATARDKEGASADVGGLRLMTSDPDALRAAQSAAGGLFGAFVDGIAHGDCPGTNSRCRGGGLRLKDAYRGGGGENCEGEDAFEVASGGGGVAGGGGPKAAVWLLSWVRPTAGRGGVTLQRRQGRDGAEGMYS